MMMVSSVLGDVVEVVNEVDVWCATSEPRRKLLFLNVKPERASWRVLGETLRVPRLCIRLFEEKTPGLLYECVNLVGTYGLNNDDEGDSADQCTSRFGKCRGLTRTPWRRMGNGEWHIQT